VHACVFYLVPQQLDKSGTSTSPDATVNTTESNKEKDLKTCEGYSKCSVANTVLLIFCGTKILRKGFKLIENAAGKH